MIIVFVSFHLDGDPAAFDEWFVPLVDETRASRGCIRYDYMLDRSDQTRRYMLEVWLDAESLAEHAGAPAHVEMLALGTLVHGMRDLDIHKWQNADEPRHSIRRRSDEHVDGREHVDALIADVQSSYLSSASRTPSA